MEKIKQFYKDKSILVTGGVGSIGKQIVKQLISLEPSVIRILDNNETGLFDVEQELASEKIRLLIGDIRDKHRMKKAVEDIDIVFHSAALKHVPLCEYNPFEAVKTNVIGTQNLLEVAIEEEVKKFITISTDKAVNPTNVMGATKLLSERLTISANHYKGKRKTIFACVRFGNVLNSRGSVVPIFSQQIKKGESVAITHPDMTRFIMSIPEATKHVLKAGSLAQEGEIFIFKMPAIKIIDLAKAMISILSPRYGHNPANMNIEVVGKRAGEKMYEELVTEDEAQRIRELGDMYIVVPPTAEKIKNPTIQSYSSNNVKVLTVEEIINELQNVLGF